MPGAYDSRDIDFEHILVTLGTNVKEPVTLLEFMVSAIGLKLGLQSAIGKDKKDDDDDGGHDIVESQVT